MPKESGRDFRQGRQSEFGGGDKRRVLEPSPNSVRRVGEENSVKGVPELAIRGLAHLP